MSTQIFKNEIPTSLLFNLLDSICIKNNKYYLLTSECFKKGMFNNCIQEFLENCKKHYHTSKQHYLERKINYNAFTTIVRQICNFNKLIYTSQIRYSNSKYDIVYLIYYKN
jgi:hypothetical protein